MTLSHQSKLFLQLIEAQNRPPWQDIPVEESRAIFGAFQSAFGEGPELASVEDRDFDGVPVRVYRCSGGDNQPCVMYFHGGGWVIGNLDTHDTLCRRLAQQSKCTVIAVDYRLAPEHRYPAAVDDCYLATHYVSIHASSLGIDPQRIIVAGDSAGGNLAGAVSLKARDAAKAGESDAPQIQLQVLIYPVVEADFTTESYRQFATGFGLAADTMQWMWEQYWDEDLTADSKYVLLTKNDLKGLPRTHIVTAEYDVLRDEGEAFARKLEQASVEVSLKRYPGVLHGFVHFSGMFDDGLRAIDDIAEVIASST